MHFGVFFGIQGYSSKKVCNISRGSSDRTETSSIMMQNSFLRTNKGQEDENDGLPAAYSSTPGLPNVLQERPFYRSIYFDSSVGNPVPRFCSHFCRAPHPIGMNQSPLPMCSASSSFNAMPWQPLTSYRAQCRFHVKLGKDSGLVSLCTGSGSSVHRPTPVYVSYVPWRVHQEECNQEAHTAAGKHQTQDRKGTDRWEELCATTSKATAHLKEQDTLHEIKEGYMKKIGSSHLSAFSSTCKKTRETADIGMYDAQIELPGAGENEILNSPQRQSSGSILSPLDASDNKSKPDVDKSLDANLKIKKEPPQSPKDDGDTEEYGFGLYESNGNVMMRNTCLKLPSINEGPSHIEHGLSSFKAQAPEATAVPTESRVHFSYNQVPSSSVHPSSRKDGSLESNSQQKAKHVCDECGRSFTRSSTLVTHKRIHSGDKPFSCEICGRAFRQPGNLSRHRLTHTTTKPYVCPHCNKAFNRASNLHTHMRTHSDYKPYACDFCDKRFHQKVDMKIHRYTHTGEKPHKCSKCGRGFKQLTHLTYHLRTHSDVRMYHCEFCGKGFNQKGNLQAHRYRHTGERPFKCNVCGKGFTLASTRNTHLRTHAEKKPFECQYCDKAFYQKNALKTHYIASHPYTGGVLIL